MHHQHLLNEQYQGFITTPPLWKNNEEIDLIQFNLSHVSEEVFKTDLLSYNLSAVLGKRIESFFSYSIRHSDRYNIVAGNIQIIENKTTLGELDFILLDRIKNSYIHVEVVYKFYIYDPTFQNELERWIGPNRRDTFLYKLSKLKKKQLPLLFHPQTKIKLKELGLKPIDPLQKVCFKALLFVPYNYRQNIYPIINNACIAGYWISFSQFLSSEFKQYEYFIPDKLDWPVEPSKNKAWCSYKEIIESLRITIIKEKSPLIWIKKNSNTFERIFVVWWSKK